MSSEPDLRAVGQAFAIDGEWRRAARHGSGHINQTYVSEFEHQGRIARYVHQAINEEIFRDAAGLMRNLERVTAHLRTRAAAAGPQGERWEVPRLVPARDGALAWRDPAGVLWRTWVCIEGVRTFDVAPSSQVAREAARAFGRFARDLADFDASGLVESIPRFHDLDGRMVRLAAAIDLDRVGRAREVEREADLARERAGIARAFADLRAGGRLPWRVVHNDTKVNNVLIDDRGRGVAVIDLDTVMPGTILFDYGDLVRTATCRAREDERDTARCVVDPELFRAVTEGYLEGVGSVATTDEREHLLLGARFMTLIVGVRFLTDYLEGDTYFRTTRPGQNLDRARAQLEILRSLETGAGRWNEVIRSVCDGEPAVSR